MNQFNEKINVHIPFNMFSENQKHSRYTDHP